MFFNGFGQFNTNYFNYGFNNMFIPNFCFQNFHFPLFNFIQPVQNIWNTPTFTTNSNVDTFSKSFPLDNYNSSKGNLLVTIAENRAVGEVGYCAKFVQEAISLAGLGSCTGAHAYEMANTLRYNPNFQEISTKEIDVNTLPAGCILVYDQCTRDLDEIYGHTEFTRGDGTGISDGISTTLDPNPSAVFIPI